MIAAKEPLTIKGVLKLTTSVGENVKFFEFERGSLATKPIFNSDGTDGGDMNVGKVGDNGFKINWAVFGKFGSGEFLNIGIFLDVTGNGDVDQGADVSFDTGASFGENSLISRGVKNHGVVATDGSILGDNDG